jgi:uncharacterized membrane protein YecN with MAPEG domain
LALLLVILAAVTIQRRMRHSAAFGDAGQHGLTSAIRAHGNLAEYAPTGVILLGLLEMAGAAQSALAASAAVFVVARVLNAIGLFNPPGPPTFSRSAGIVVTLLVLTGWAAWLLVLVAAAA